MKLIFFLLVAPIFCVIVQFKTGWWTNRNIEVLGTRYGVTWKPGEIRYWSQPVDLAKRTTYLYVNFHV